MKVFITASAQADIDEIVDYITAENPGHALNFGDELMDRCHELGDFPRPIRSFQDMKTRAFVAASTETT
jgi:plasmid stabilization system protein ParE